HDEPGFGISASLRTADASVRRLLLGSAAWCGIDDESARAMREAPPAARGSPADRDALAGASEVFLVERSEAAGGAADTGGQRIEVLARIALADAPRPE